jgi:hypothetical protein
VALIRYAIFALPSVGGALAIAQRYGPTWVGKASDREDSCCFVIAVFCYCGESHSAQLTKASLPRPVESMRRRFQ